MIVNKPNSLGVWYSDQGHVAFISEDKDDSDLRYFCIVAPPNYAYHGHRWERGLEDLSFPESRWQKGSPPKFPELPPKPKLYGLCLVKCGLSDVPRWRAFIDGVSHNGWPAEVCEVVPHPDNDPEAVRLIEEAKSGT